MKRFLCFFVLFNFSFFANASHFVGYDMHMENIAGSDSYKFTLRIYQDVSTAFFGSGITFYIYENGTNAKYNPDLVFTKTGESFVTYNSNQCLTPNANTILKVGTYQYTLPASVANLLISTNGYYIASSNCCRFENATNFLNSYTIGYTMVMEFPKLMPTVTRYNSSPKFRYPPILKFIVGKNYTIDWSAEDINSDSLVYSLVLPLNDDSYFKPFGSIQYATGFNLNSNVADGLPDFNINQATGIGTYSPMKPGNYLVAVKVEEYRNGIKIGEIRREMQFNSVMVNDFIPILSDLKGRVSIIRDTISSDEEYVLNLKGRDILGDSISLFAVPDTTASENLFDQYLYGAKFGAVGSLQTGSAAENLVLQGDSVLYGQFRWKPICKNSRQLPYKMNFIVKDRNCPTANKDTIILLLYVKKKPNSPPMFISPDSIINNKVLKYYVKQNTLFQLNGDSIIKTYDQDSTQVVNMFIIQDPNNPGLSNFSFIPNPSPVNSTATFSAVYTCQNVGVFGYTIFAFDDDCLKGDTSFLKLEIIVIPDQLVKETICGVTVDSIQQKNIIFWNGLNANASNYLIYRYHSVVSQYLQIAAIPAGASNYYLDISSNSNYGDEKYKIEAGNSCGDKSPVSDVSGSIFLNAKWNSNSGLADLTWNRYSGSANDSIQIFYGSNFISNYQIFATLPISDTSYSTQNIFMGENKYRVDIKFSDTCFIPLLGGNNYKISSNISTILSGSISKGSRIYYSIQPNPTTNTIRITGLPENELVDLVICDIQGKIVLSNKYLNGEPIDLSELNNGVYLIKVNGGVQKVVKM